MNNSDFISLPYGFPVEYKRFRRSSIEKEYFRDFLDVRLPEVSAEEAPIAIEVKRKEEYGNLTYRHHDGKLYLQVKSLKGLNIASADIQRLFSQHDSFLFQDNDSVPHYEFPQNLMCGSASPLKIADFNDGKVLKDEKSKIVTSYQDEWRDKAGKSYAENYKIIGGELWSTVNAMEPIIVLSLGENPDLTMYLDKDPLYYCNQFRIDQLEEAKALAESYPRSVDIEQMTVVIHNPELVSRKTENMLRDQAVAIVKALIFKVSTNVYKEILSGLVAPNKKGDELTFREAMQDLHFIDNFSQHITNTMADNIGIIKKRANDLALVEDIEINDELSTLRF